MNPRLPALLTISWKLTLESTEGEKDSKLIRLLGQQPELLAIGFPANAFEATDAGAWAVCRTAVLLTLGNPDRDDLRSRCEFANGRHESGTASYAMISSIA